jgi:choline dehydrogenase
MLSGIGPGDHLRDIGVGVVHDLPTVGKNLHDHFFVQLMFRVNRPITLNDLSRSWPRKIAAGLQYLALKSGPLSINGIFAGAFVRSDGRLERPDLQLNMNSWSVAKRTREGAIPHPFPGITISPVHLKPEGRGEVLLKSSDPMVAPAIHFRCLATPYDVDAMIAGIRMIRAISQQPALKALISAEIQPGLDVEDERSLEAFLRELGYPNLHPVGTCRMGSDPSAVVDAQLKVNGVRALRVVDASVMPRVVAGNTNAPTVMIAEKASDMILREASAA